MLLRTTKNTMRWKKAKSYKYHRDIHPTPRFGRLPIHTYQRVLSAHTTSTNQGGRASSTREVTQADLFKRLHLTPVYHVTVLDHPTLQINIDFLGLESANRRLENSWTVLWFGFSRFNPSRHLDVFTLHGTTLADAYSDHPCTMSSCGLRLYAADLYDSGIVLLLMSYNMVIRSHIFKQLFTTQSLPFWSINYLYWECNTPWKLPSSPLNPSLAFLDGFSRWIKQAQRKVGG